MTICFPHCVLWTLQLGSRTTSPHIPFPWPCGPCRSPCPQGLSCADPVLWLFPVWQHVMALGTSATRNHFPTPPGKTTLGLPGFCVLAVPSPLQRLRAESGLCHTSTEEEERPLQEAKVKVGFVFVCLIFFFIAVILQCLNLVLPEVNTVCGNLQVLSYSSAHPRRRRKVGSETQVKKHY